MSGLAENVEKVKNAHAGLKAAISAKGVKVPAGAKLSDMPALIGGIAAMPETSDLRLSIADKRATIDLPQVICVDTSTARDLSSIFYNSRNLSSLTLPAGFGSAATDLGYCFQQCYGLTSLSLPAGFGSAATKLQSCFASCEKLSSLALPAGFGRNATDLSYCFSNCEKLATLTLPPGFGRNATNLTGLFTSCYALTTIEGGVEAKVALSLSYAKSLTHDSLVNVLHALQTVTRATNLTLGSGNLEKLTDAEKKIATDKGWTLA